MEPHGGINEEGPQPETGLEEPMWRMGLLESGGGGGGGESYPERPNEADCIYYLRTGFCGYGARCRFNHPRDRSTVIGAARADAGELPKRVGQPICQYYMRTGTCKFGASCKYHHPRHVTGSTSPVPLNYYGYPLRPGDKECSYYVKTGQCKFGSTCKFHHPQPAGIHVPVPPAPPTLPVGAMPSAMPTSSSYPPMMQSPSIPSSQQYGVVVARPSFMPSYVQGPYGHLLLSPGMVPVQGWSPYQVPMNPVSSSGAQPTSGANPLYGITQLSPFAPAYTGPFQPSVSPVAPLISAQNEQSLPQRPGQPDCQHYLKTGDCKFGSSCRYHHPPDPVEPNMNVILSPFRPSHSPSASSLAVSYSSGSSSGTLAPSASSPELQDEPNSTQSIGRASA